MYNRKFGRQHGIGSYIVDFYCPEEKLIIELDSAAHYEKEIAEYDKKRDVYLREL